ncbi:hypothetical protein F4824DRAFT_102173 [Ustulina deusta]|nr:hypothetical protein F4824DRAFT_102173 [Ustulina deusta]
MTDTDSDDEIITRPPMHNPPSASPIRRSTPAHRKRQAEGSIAHTGPPPLKRRKAEFNGAYLNLLNQDIQDASSGLINGEEGPELGHTQLGAVVWSAAEKRVYFAAVSRLGKEDVAGISARIGTKSELEVRQYLVFLEAAKRQPRTDEGRRGGAQHAHALRPVDIPAAVEIGAECGAMLETAADGLSLRQGGYEEEVERERWGPWWRVTAPLARILENRVRCQQQRRQYSETSPPQTRGGEEWGEKSLCSKEEEQEQEQEQGERNEILKELPFLQLFHVQNWLRLSDRVFMNSAVSDGNWRAVSEEDEPPAIQATALSDFHGLALSVTRRLLLAAMYVAESRVRTRSLNDARRRGQPRLRVEDVKAAASSLGMTQNSRQFWARCARRLQLNVVDHETEEDNLTDHENEGTDTDVGEDMDIDEQLSTVESSPGNTEDADQEAEESDEEDDYEIMSYDEVEAALGYPVADSIRNRPSNPEPYVLPRAEHISSPSEDETHSQEYDEENEEGRTEEEEEDDDDDEDDEDDDEDDDDGLNADSIKKDIEEATISLAPIEHTDDTDTTPARRALKSWIRAEHRLERDAERLDLKASADAETKLWAMLRGDGNLRSKGQG